jgi:hypothetical protein
LIQEGIFAERPDISGRITGQVQEIILESDEKVQFEKPDAPVLIGQIIIKELRETMRS